MILELRIEGEVGDLDALRRDLDAVAGMAGDGEIGVGRAGRLALLILGRAVSAEIVSVRPAAREAAAPFGRRPAGFVP
jgi:hypothetical protein